MNNYAKDLFQLQSELTDRKVDMAVSKSIDRVVDQLIALKSDMNDKFSHLENRFTSLEHRVVANEKTLKSITTVLNELRSKFIGYSFKAVWIILGGMTIFLLSQLHIFIK